MWKINIAKRDTRRKYENENKKKKKKITQNTRGKRPTQNGGKQKHGEKSREKKIN